MVRQEEQEPVAMATFFFPSYNRSFFFKGVRVTVRLGRRKEVRGDLA
jgi:hypothetical protein